MQLRLECVNPVVALGEHVVHHPRRDDARRRVEQDRVHILARRPPMALLDRHVVPQLELVDRLEHREPLADRMDADVPQALVIDVNEDLTGDAVFTKLRGVS